MKKLLLSSLLVAISAFTFITSANAQKGFYVGVQGAPQLSVLFNSDDIDKPDTDYKSKFSSTFGISTGYNITNNAGLGTEVMYSIARQRYLYDDKEYTQQCNYLKIPLMFTYNSNPAARVMFTAKAGPQLGILLKSEISHADEHSLNGRTNHRYNHFTYGARAGFGARARVARHMYLEGGLRFDGTFTNIENENYAGYVPGRAKTYDLNTGIEVGVRYLFN